MGRSDPQRKQAKPSKVSKVHKQQGRLDAKKGRREAKEPRRRTGSDEIQPIDTNDNYVMPSAFEVCADDLALFDRLNAIKAAPATLEKNLREFIDDAREKSPAKDPEVVEVYQR